MRTAVVFVVPLAIAALAGGGCENRATALPRSGLDPKSSRRPDGGPGGEGAAGADPSGDSEQNGRTSQRPTAGPAPDDSTAGHGGGANERCGRGALRFSGEPRERSILVPVPVVTAAAFGDLNGDGTPDVVTAHRGGSTLLVHKSDGKGGLVAPLTVTLKDELPRFLATKDMNGDGKLDLIIVGAGLTIALGDGEGQFKTAWATERALGPAAVGDVTGDGRPDVVATDGANLFVLRAPFEAGPDRFDQYPLSRPRSSLDAAPPVLADLDGDGSLEVAVASVTTLTVGARTASGPLALRDLPAPGGPRIDPEILAVDLDGDGDAELVGSAGVWRNDGSLAFAFVAAPGPRPLDTADLDGDGVREILGSSADGRRLRVARYGKGLAATTERVLLPTLSTEAVLAGAVADLDGDGWPDALVVDRRGVHAHQNDGRGWKPRAGLTDFELQPDTRPEHTIAADLDGDGDLDIATANTNGTISLLRNDGRGRFEAAPTIQGFRMRVEGLAAADLDGDGRLDLAAASEGESMPAGQVTVLANRGSFTFAPVTTRALQGPVEAIKAADLDGDGVIDLVTADGEYTNRLTVLAGDGRLGLGRLIPLSVGEQPESLAFGDFDGDGRLDIASANEASDSVTVLRGAGGLTFGGRRDISVGPTPEDITAADLDGDGHLDLVTANSAVARTVPSPGLVTGSVTVLWNNRRGDFSERTDERAGSGPRAVATGDIDGDGDLDIVVANGESSDVTVLVNDGRRRFRRVTLPAGLKPQGVVVAPLDGGCLPDVLVASKLSSSLRIFLSE